MTKAMHRACYTLALRQQAVRLLKGGQSISAAARSLGVVDQAPFSGVPCGLPFRSAMKKGLACARPWSA